MEWECVSRRNGKNVKLVDETGIDETGIDEMPNGNKPVSQPSQRRTAQIFFYYSDGQF